MGHRIHLDERNVCCIKVHGRIGQHWQDYFQGLAISTESESSQVVTTLKGELPDQAALLGAINYLYQMGHSLISVDCEPCPNTDL